MESEVTTNELKNEATVSSKGPEFPRGLAMKLSKLQQVIKNPQKSGVLIQFDFRYSNRDDVAAVIKPALASVGLIIMPNISSYERKPNPGRPGWFYTAYVDICLIDSDTGESWIFKTVGESYEMGDKGLPKCLTSAIRHWAINSFWLSDGGEEGLYYESPEPPMNKQKEYRNNNNYQSRRNRDPEPEQVLSIDDMKRVIIGELMTKKGFNEEEAVAFANMTFDKPNKRPGYFDQVMAKMRGIGGEQLKNTLNGYLASKNSTQDNQIESNEDEALVSAEV